jgi:general secretion pathway protein D
LRYAALSVALLTCFVVGPAQAQQETLYTPNYRDADIRMVAEEVQRVIRRPIIMDPRVRAQVTILSNQPMTAGAFYETFLAALEVHGFAARQSGNAILVVPGLQENRE